MSKLFLFIFTTFITLSCANQTDKIKAGSICTIEDGEGKFGIVKVLVINDQEAHVKIYKNKFDRRPAQVDIKTLSLGSINNMEGGFGIGHVPLERSGFDNWKPISIGFEEVTQDDLVGYEMWKNQ
ncbi:MAG: hypothetical protein J7604_25005 [Sporocytophaga sp.]|uniref:hypothetical protein n=1 Tax=Sporocytophaga sp. TaxID=2231183 RepID=UPI001B1E5ACC|nr:hypothetical protein [Sporocytophaga sp.]MBO9703491.1 hypothetical protein [Sporocytophaga sp.]